MEGSECGEGGFGGRRARGGEDRDSLRRGEDYFAVEAAGGGAPGGVDVVWVNGDIAAGAGGGRGCVC